MADGELISNPAQTDKVNSNYTTTVSIHTSTIGYIKRKYLPPFSVVILVGIKTQCIHW